MLLVEFLNLCSIGHPVFTVLDGACGFGLNRAQTQETVIRVRVLSDQLEQDMGSTSGVAFQCFERVLHISWAIFYH